MSNKANTGWLYYKKYYDLSQRSPSGIKDINKNLLATDIHQIEVAGLSITKCDEKIPSLKTTYPGLLMGVGYTHEFEDADENLKNEAFKIGFHFDYTFGMPVIPGSSVKGLLRSAFPQRNARKPIYYQQEKEEWIKSILKKNCSIGSETDIDMLEAELFDGLNKNNKPIPVYNRDIFFDAIPVSIVKENCNKRKQLFASDYITPHKHTDRKKAHLDPFVDPRPLKFLKVLPEVAYQFCFRLHDSTIQQELTTAKKWLLFKEIIFVLGLGAKTNVGYGQFIEVEEPLKQYDALQLKNTDVIEARYKGFNTEQRKQEFETNLLNYKTNTAFLSTPANVKLPKKDNKCHLKITVIQQNKNQQIGNIQFAFLPD